MLETLRDVTRETPYLLRHAPLKSEMQTFVKGRSGPAAAPGCHDDLVMAAAGAYTIAAEYATRPVIVTNRRGPKKPRSFQDVLSRASKGNR